MHKIREDAPNWARGLHRVIGSNSFVITMHVSEFHCLLLSRNQFLSKILLRDPDLTNAG